MSIATKSLDQITGEDLAALAGAAPDPQHLATLAAWDKAEATKAAASLANSGGGLVVVNADVTEADLLGAADDLGPYGRYLARARIVDAAGKRVGLLAVAESAAPPVLVETTGAIYARSAAGLVQVRSRLELDQLLAKERMLRQRAERHVEGMLDRLAFGHFNYLTVAVWRPRGC